MALVLADRVLETTTSTGSGTITLAGAEPGYQSFAVVGNGNETYYTIAGDTEWEVGIGTYTSSGTTLSRDTVLSSSDSGNKVTFSSGVKKVFVTYPSEKSVNRNVSGDITAASGRIINLGAPILQSDATTKEYVDQIAIGGVHYHTPVQYEVPDTTGNLNATYNQPGGTGVGVSATLTNAGSLVPFVPDGVTATISDRVLVYNQTNAYENGVYVVTTVGDGSTAWVLTRASDADTYAPSDPNSLGEGDAFFVTSGDTGAGETYVCNTEGTISFGSTAISFVQVSAARVYQAGNGISITNSTISLVTPVSIANGGTGQATAPSNGQLLIGNGVSFVLSTLTAGSGVSITNSAGGITLTTTNSGAVTAVTATGPLASSGGTTPDISIANATGTGSVVLDQGATISSATITAAVSASITTITGTSANITTVTGTTAGFSSANITQLSGTSAGITTVSGTTTTFSSGTITQFGATSATIATVSGTNVTYSNGNFTSATVTTISGTTATYTSAAITNISATSLTVTNAIAGSITGNAGTATKLQTARTINGVSFDGSANITVTANTPNSATFNNGGSGDASGTTFNGSAARTISYNTIGAPSTTGTNASGTWGISVTGNAATVTDGMYLASTQTSGGRKSFSANQNVGTMLNITGGLGGLEAVNPGGANAAFMSFHRVGAFAAYFGLDTDNNFAVGGWSFGSALGSMKVGSFGVGTAASGTAGEIRATNNITAYYSDARLKDFKGKIDNALSKVSQLNGYYYTENEKAEEFGYNNKELQVGVSAQEVKAVLPEVIAPAPFDMDAENKSKSGEDYMTVRYEKLVPLLIEAIKELKAEVEALKAGK